MKAVCWNGITNVGVEDVPDPKLINPRDAIIQVTSTAICGSDLHLHTVNAVAPGFIETQMTAVLSAKIREGFLAQIPLGRAGTTEAVAGAVTFLASDQAAYLTGQVLHVSGGMYM